MPNRPGPIARLSIGTKVPLVAGALILTVAATVSIASYLEVRHSARRDAYQHITDVTQLVRSSFQGTAASLTRTVQPVAASPAIAAYLGAPDAAHRPAALAALLARTASAGRTMATELRDETGRVILSTNPPVSSTPTDYPPSIPPRDTVSVGRLRLLHDSIVYPVSARIPGVAGAYLVQWRHATNSAQSNQQTSKLIGAGATLLLGNIDGTLWTDLDKRVAGPPGDPLAWKNPVEYTRVARNGPVVAGGVPLEGTPWAFVIEFPLRKVMAPAATFLRDVGLLSLAFAALAALAAGWLARRMTSPLLRLTEAADAIASGGHGSGVELARTDELGRLAASFEAMALQVRESRQRLEENVTERTRELHNALRRLEDTQETLVRREKLATLGQLAGGVGHELRNPLGVMSNAIYYLEMVLQPAPDNVREYLHLLRDQVALSSKIVGDLLDFGRIAPAHRHPIVLRTIVDAQVSRLPAHDNVRIDVDIPAALPDVEVDAVHIGQVVFNLLTNAIQAVDGGSGRVHVTAAQCGSHIELRVADNGPGVAPELVARIFEPLFTTKARGIGLGLAVSRALAQANDGEITLTSQPGSGATFTVHMPASVAVPA